MVDSTGCLDYDCFDVSYVEEEAGGVIRSCMPDTYRRKVKQSMEQLLGNIRVFIGYLAEIELMTMPNGKVTRSVRLPSNGEEYLSIHNG